MLKKKKKSCIKQLGTEIMVVTKKRRSHLNHASLLSGSEFKVQTPCTGLQLRLDLVLS